MSEVRAKALLQSLSIEFELLQAQNEELSRKNDSFAVQVTSLRSQLGSKEANGLAVESMPRHGMMQQNLAFLKDRGARPPPPQQTSHFEDLSPDAFSLPDADAQTIAKNQGVAATCTAKSGNPSTTGSTLKCSSDRETCSENTEVQRQTKMVMNNQSVASDPGEKRGGPSELHKSKTGDTVRTSRTGDTVPISISEMRHAEDNLPGTPGLPQYKLWHAWTNLSVSDAGRTVSVRQARTMESDEDVQLETRLKNMKYGAEIRSPHSFVQYFVIRPGSKRQITWDILSVLFMSCDVLLVPLRAFPLPQTDFMVGLDWASVVFWTLDIPNNFLTGFHKDGIYEMRPIKIARRYIRKFFFLDSAIVLVDWLVVCTSDFRSNGVFHIVKSYRVARALRLIRVVRVAKLLNMLVEFSDHLAFFHSGAVKIVIDVVKVILFILVASHFLACGWYAIGSMDVDFESGEADRWVIKFDNDQGGDPSLWYQYTTALHWALTQFTPASMEVVPRNVAERSYAVVVLLLAVVTFSSFVSSVTSSMTRLRMMNMDRAKEKEDIRRYIIDHRMTLGVGNRINLFLRKQDSKLHARVHEEDVALFKYLPEALRVDMHREVFLPVLIPHPFFHHYHEFLDDASLATICHTAMYERALGRGEYVFSWGETASHMFFIQGGVCEYTLGAAMHKDVTTVECNEMVAEAVLWMPWEHVGRLLVVKHVELATLDSVIMQAILRGQPAALPAKAYATRFLQILNIKNYYTDLSFDMDTLLEVAQLAWEDVSKEKGESDKSVATTASRRIGKLREFALRMRKSVASTLGFED